MANGRLLYGTSDVEALRLAGQIYVDKTDLIFDLASERSKIFLFGLVFDGNRLAFVRYGVADGRNCSSIIRT